MEVRSSRRMRTLVTQMACRGLSANEVARALISMMAGSLKRSNQRPDTLMQDRSLPTRRRLLRRAAGPYIRVRSRHGESGSGCLLWAMNGLVRCNNRRRVPLHLLAKLM